MNCNLNFLYYLQTIFLQLEVGTKLDSKYHKQPICPSEKVGKMTNPLLTQQQAKKQCG